MHNVDEAVCMCEQEALGGGGVGCRECVHLVGGHNEDTIFIRLELLITCRTKSLPQLVTTCISI